MEFSGTFCIRQKCDFNVSLFEIPETPGVAYEASFTGKRNTMDENAIQISCRLRKPEKEKM